MKSLSLFGIVMAASLTFTACEPRQPRKPNQAVEKKDPADDKPKPPGTPTIDPNAPTDDTPRDNIDKIDPIPKRDAIPQPTPNKQPEYGIKVEARPGYVRSPYDPQHRIIDVRNLPPGTEIEDPWVAGRTLLVP